MYCYLTCVLGSTISTVYPPLSTLYNVNTYRKEENEIQRWVAVEKIP